MQTEFRINSRGAGLYEFTAPVREWVASAGPGPGLLTLFVRHTSCSLLIQENAVAVSAFRLPQRDKTGLRVNATMPSPPRQGNRVKELCGDEACEIVVVPCGSLEA